MITVLGDFNSKHPSRDTHSPTNVAGLKLSGVFFDFSFCQSVSSPTQFLSDGRVHSVLDLFATTHPDLVKNIDVSDMIPDLCCMTAKISVEEPVSEASKKSFAHMLHSDRYN